jgi:NAD(P)-dependent dehydrogenase (short-subunit alcohol dehydrogenase family)
MRGDQAGRVAVITGGGRSIGQAFARRLAEDGAKIVIADLADASESVALVEHAGSEGIAVRCDVSSADDVSAMAQAAFDAFGQVDILVHNAAIYPSAMFADMTFDEWRRMMSINLDSGFHLCHEFLPGMRERNWGRVVFTSSTTFYTAPPGLAHYTASKGGVMGLLRTLATEVGDDGVTVNGIAPSIVRTEGSLELGWDEMFDAIAETQAIKRIQVPSDLVGALSFLASDDAAFITGQTLCVDGGRVRA